MPLTSFELKPIGRVQSPLTDPAAAPNQGDEGAPDAWLIIDAEVSDALAGVTVGDELLAFTWLHRAQRDTLQVHPRGDESRPLHGVFATRSPHRPNPIGLHRVEVAEIEGNRIRVHRLEAVDGTPLIDLKPILSDEISER